MGVTDFNNIDISHLFHMCGLFAYLFPRPWKGNNQSPPNKSKDKFDFKDHDLNCFTEFLDSTCYCRWPPINIYCEILYFRIYRYWNFEHSVVWLWDFSGKAIRCIWIFISKFLLIITNDHQDVNRSWSTHSTYLKSMFLLVLLALIYRFLPKALTFYDLI